MQVVLVHDLPLISLLVEFAQCCPAMVIDNSEIIHCPLNSRYQFNSVFVTANRLLGAVHSVLLRDRQSATAMMVVGQFGYDLGLVEVSPEVGIVGLQSRNLVLAEAIQDLLGVL